MISEDIRQARDARDRNRVLVICGEPRVLAEIKKELMERFDVSIAATSDAALTVLNVYGADAIVICINGNADEVFFLFERVSQCAAGRGTPILCLAERDDERDEAAAFRAGAADYSVRRREGSGALAHRINLRIRAAGKEYPKAIAAEELAGKTILIAEDIALNRDIIAAILSEADGLTVEFASDGCEAVELFERNAGRYALIFMDVQMPVMDGLTAARTIRNLGGAEAREIPIIALTASVSKEEIAGFFDAGMNDYLEKPMEYENFLRVCAKHIRASAYLNFAKNSAFGIL